MNTFDLAIIGRGRVGSTVGSRLAIRGWQVAYGVRNPELWEDQVDGIRWSAIDGLGDSSAATPVMSVHDAIRCSDLILLAIPWSAVEGVCRSFPDWSGKTIIDCSNPLTDDFRGLRFGFDTSAAEMIAAWAQGADVVKTLNTASSLLMSSPTINGESSTMFFCGGSEKSQQAVGRMLTDLDFEPFYCGPLSNARYLEPLAMLLIDIGIRNRVKTKFGLQFVIERE